TIEFLENLYDAEGVAEFVRSLKPLQDDLGYANDVRVANELLGDLRISDGSVTIARATGVVLGWHDRGLADFDRKLRTHMRRFRGAGPFWGRVSVTDCAVLAYCSSRALFRPATDAGTATVTALPG